MDLLWGCMEVDCLLRRKTEEEAEALPWLEHMVPAVIPELVGHLWMKPPRKRGFVAVCGLVRPCVSLFWHSLAAQRALGHQNVQRTAGPFRADCYPAGNSLHVLLSQFISTHKHTEETWLSVSRFSLPSFLPPCFPWIPSRFSNQIKQDGWKDPNE